MGFGVFQLILFAFPISNRMIRYDAVIWIEGPVFAAALFALLPVKKNWERKDLNYNITHGNQISPYNINRDLLRLVSTNILITVLWYKFVGVFNPDPYFRTKDCFEPIKSYAAQHKHVTYAKVFYGSHNVICALQTPYLCALQRVLYQQIRTASESRIKALKMTTITIEMVTKPAPDSFGSAK